MLVLTVLVGGAYFAASLARLILPDAANPDAVMPQLVQLLLPSAGVHLFVLAVVSASLSTATALFHIAVMAAAEDVPGRKSTRASWIACVALCVLVSAGCAQAEGRLIAIIHTTSWSIVGATALVPYVALVRFGRRNRRAAWCSAVCGFVSCLFCYLCLYKPTALTAPLLAELSQTPPFFVGLGCSLAGWTLGLALGTAGERGAERAAERAAPSRQSPAGVEAPSVHLEN